MRSPLAAAATLALTALAYGCQERVRPWEQGDVDASSPPPLASPAVPLFLPDRDGGALVPSPAPPGSTAPAEDRAGDGGKVDEEAVEAPTPPVRVGGPWVRCYGNFHRSGEPVKDVTRLALLCGPENGMHRLTKQPIEGAVEEGGMSATQTFEAHRGECYRVFAVAEPSVPDLDVTVRSSRGAALAADHGEDSWPIVQPDRPICPLSDDRYTVEVTAHRGKGRFAAEVWVLRSPGKAAASEPR
uniref:Lipoprotein n=1 Tax=Byssovorax cruenta TaxID=293647 RepID=A0A3S7UZ84_9BACT|nr:hypothetical protein [Byssovorax cruenta]